MASIETTPAAGNPLAVDRGARPTVGLLVGWFVVHVVVWIGLVSILPGSDGVDYADLGALSTPWVRQFVIPLLVVLALQVILLRRTGWTDAVLRDSVRSTRRWMWAPPVVIVLLAVAAFANSGFAADAGSSYLIGCALTMLLVGATEEITFRGILLVGGRRTFAREWQAVVFSSVLFGLFHTPNIILGAEVSDALRQTVFTAVIGAGFYALRRVSGSLVPCIVLHAVYDFVLIQANWDILLTP